MKKALLIGLPLLLVIGIVGGLGYIGLINLPFMPKKKGPKAPKDDGKGGPFASYLAMTEGFAKRADDEAALAKAKVPPTPPIPPLDPGPGEKKLASLWAEMPTDRLVAVVEKWPEPQLGRILSKMDAEAVTNLLGTLPAPRAASLSRAIATATDERASKVHTNAEK